MPREWWAQVSTGVPVLPPSPSLSWSRAAPPRSSPAWGWALRPPEGCWGIRVESHPCDSPTCTGEAKRESHVPGVPPAWGTAGRERTAGDHTLRCPFLPAAQPCCPCPVHWLPSPGVSQPTHPPLPSSARLVCTFSSLIFVGVVTSSSSMSDRLLLPNSPSSSCFSPSASWFSLTEAGRENSAHGGDPGSPQPCHPQPPHLLCPVPHPACSDLGTEEPRMPCSKDSWSRGSQGTGSQGEPHPQSARPQPCHIPLLMCSLSYHLRWRQTLCHGDAVGDSLQKEA